MFWYQFINTILEMCKFFVVCRLAFDFQWRKRWYIVLGDLILILGGTCYYTWYEYALQPIFVYLVVYGGIILLTFSNVGKWYRFLGIYMWTIISTTFMSVINEMMLPIQNVEIKSLSSSAVTVVFFGVIFSYVRFKTPNGLLKIHAGYYILFSLLGLSNQVVLSMLYEDVQYEDGYSIPFLVVSIGVLIQMAMVLLLAVSNNTWKERQELNRKYLDSQEKHYMYLQKKEEETKKFRHDIRNHLYTLDELMREENKEEFHRYMKKVFGIVEAPIHHVDTGNSIVDAILNQYVDIFLHEEIEFDIKGHLPSDCFVSAYDLCVIFSNMMQNALEAVQECEEKYISLLLRYDEQAIYVQQKNSYKTIILKNNKPISNKKDKKSHGYGSINMGESVINYQGTINYEVNDNVFVVLLYLQRPFAR